MSKTFSKGTVNNIQSVNLCHLFSQQNSLLLIFQILQNGQQSERRPKRVHFTDVPILQ